MHSALIDVEGASVLSVAQWRAVQAEGTQTVLSSTEVLGATDSIRKRHPCTPQLSHTPTCRALLHALSL